MIMNTWLDYIFYRTAQLFYKRGGRRGFPGVIVISLSQSFLIMAVVFLLENHFVEKAAKASYNQEVEYIIVIMFVLLIYLNYRKYEGKYNKLRFTWKDEEQGERFFKGILVVASLILPPVIFI